ncbi:MAG TPA: hypothetical protein VLJ68_10805 [Chitinophagaceae bacterium]|nr:hypothetical protein [Chitinophagaceae bacterium]
MLALSLSVLLFFLPLTDQQNQPGKKEQILQLSKKYFPENYKVLEAYDEKSINSMADGQTVKEYVYSISTVVHEGFHTYQNTFTSYYDTLIRYRINDTLWYGARNFKTFPSKEINKIVPLGTRKKIFRYDTYVNSKEKIHVTQQYGALGLLEEMVAYYHSFATELALFNYFRDQYGWSDAEPWIKYLGAIGGFRYSLIEFELFISWYLQVAQSDHPAIYKSIVADPWFKATFRFLHNANIRFTTQYDINRKIILEKLGDKVMIMSDAIIPTAALKPGYSGYSGAGLFDTDLKTMQDMLQQPEHKILDQLLK